jgi:1-acyl-sn-glycerol-3-phosphate acyltransferase
VLRILRSLWIWSAAAALFLFWTLLMALTRLFDRDPLHRRTARCFRRLGPALAKVNPAWRVHVSGTEHIVPGQTYVLVSNHQSLADIPVVSHLRLDAKWMGKAEIFKLPLIGWMLRMAGDVPVDRTDRRNGAKALLQCAQYLRKGLSVVFFPEGTRSRDGAVLPFNAAPFQLAIREGAAVLPVVVEGSGAALPRGSWIFAGTRDIWVKVLEAVPVTGWNPRQGEALRDTVRQKIVDELESMRKV